MPENKDRYEIQEWPGNEDSIFDKTLNSTIGWFLKSERPFVEEMIEYANTAWRLQNCL